MTSAEMINKLVTALTEEIAKLNLRVKKLEETLNWRKQAAEERFIPPNESAIPGIMPNVGED